MSPKTVEQNEDLKNRRREQILEVSLRLFADKGYHATSISNIAKEAGIAKGLLYNYFTSKEQLLNVILMKGIEDIVIFFDPDNDHFLTNDEMIFFLDKVKETLIENREFWRLYYSLMFQPDVLKYIDIIKITEKFEYIFRDLENYLSRMGFEDPVAETQVIHLILDGLLVNYCLQDNNSLLDLTFNYMKKKYTK